MMKSLSGNFSNWANLSVLYHKRDAIVATVSIKQGLPTNGLGTKHGLRLK